MTIANTMYIVAKAKDLPPIKIDEDPKIYVWLNNPYGTKQNPNYRINQRKYKK